MKFKAAVFLFVTAIITYAIIGFVSSNVTGTVNMTIIPSPPSIEEVSITPETAYAGSAIECNAKVSGNNPRDYTVNYSWYVNNESKGAGKQIHGLNANDKISCGVSAYDSFGRGETKTASITIKSRIAGITGSVVGSIQSSKSKGVISFVFFILLIFVFLRHHYITTNFKNKKAKDR